MSLLSRKGVFPAGFALAIASALSSGACNYLVELPDPQTSNDASTPQPDAASAIDGDEPDAIDANKRDAFEAGMDAVADADGAGLPRQCVDGGIPSDPNNCGWCGHSCGGSTCSGSVCTPTALIPPHGQRQGIGFVTPVDGSVFFIEWCGFAPATRVGANGQTVSLGGEGCARGMVRDGDQMLFTIFRDGAPNTTDMLSVPIAGISATLVLQGAEDFIWSFALDDTTMFYSRGSAGWNGIYARPRGAALTAYGESLDSGAAESLVLGSDTIYFVGGSRVQSMSKTGGSPQTLYAGVQPQGIHMDATSLYWFDGASTSISRGAIDGSTPSVTLASNLPSFATDLAIDAKSVYFTVKSTIYAVDKDGSNLRIYATWIPEDADAASPADIATSVNVDDTYVYWGRTISHGSSLWRVRK